MKIAVVGSINRDMTVYTDRIPHPGETLPGQSIECQPGGKGANQAVAVAKLGAEVMMFGCVGNDGIGRELLDNLNSHGIDIGSIQVLDGTATGQALITVGGGDNTIVVISGANDHVGLPYVEQNLTKILSADFIVLQNEIPAQTLEYLIRRGHKEGKKIIWNPAPARSVREELIDMVTYLTPNEHEAAVMWPEEKGDIAALLSRYPEKLILTRGEHGVSYCRKETGVITVPAIAAAVADTTGAGDTLNGALCVGLVRGMTLIEALRFANIAAGLAVQKKGAQAGMPTLAAVLAASAGNSVI